MEELCIEEELEIVHDFDQYWTTLESILDFQKGYDIFSKLYE